MEWSLRSPAFDDGGSIPDRYTCEGENVSPELEWSEAPEGTKELALICNDPDAPAANWIHWVLYGLPAETRSLPAGVPNSETVADLGGAKQGPNTGGGTGYTGPCPPSGPAHHYHFRLYALDAGLDLGPGATESDLAAAMEGHVLAEAEIVGLYAR